MGLLTKKSQRGGVGVDVGLEMERRGFSVFAFVPVFLRRRVGNSREGNSIASIRV
jgi:hypothetical protein